MAEESKEQQENPKEPLVRKDAKSMREEQQAAQSTSANAAPKKKKKKRGKQLEIPEHTRITFLLFPPYGIAWLLTNKSIDKDLRKFGAIGMAIYLIIWAIPLALMAYAYVIMNA